MESTAKVGLAPARGQLTEEEYEATTRARAAMAQALVDAGYGTDRLLPMAVATITLAFADILFVAGKAGGELLAQVNRELKGSGLRVGPIAG